MAPGAERHASVAVATHIFNDFIGPSPAILSPRVPFPARSRHCRLIRRFRKGVRDQIFGVFIAPYAEVACIGSAIPLTGWNSKECRKVGICSRRDGLKRKRRLFVEVSARSFQAPNVRMLRPKVLRPLPDCVWVDHFRHAPHGERPSRCRSTTRAALRATVRWIGSKRLHLRRR